MAAGTVGYTDTRGNKDYLGMIASQIKNRVTEASDMANEERQFAEEKAESGGTSLDEAGIGKGFFFGKALGSRFGGDAIARTRGRFAKTPGAGIDPAGNAASRFRGGFDFNVTNEIATGDTSNIEAALISGLSGVSQGLQGVSQALIKIDDTLGGLERTQMDMARAIMFQGYINQMLLSQQQRAAGRDSLRREERSIEGGGSGRIGGAGFGGGGGGRGMINVTPGGRRSGGGFNPLRDGLGSFGTSQLLGRNTATKGALSKGTNLAKSVNLSKVARNTSNLLKVPATGLRSAFTNAKNLTPLKSLKALKDTITAQSAAGLLGLRLNPVEQLKNFSKISKYDKVAQDMAKGTKSFLRGGFRGASSVQPFLDAMDSTPDEFAKFIESFEDIPADQIDNVFDDLAKTGFKQSDFKHIATGNYSPESLITSVHSVKNPKFIEPATELMEGVSRPPRIINKKLSQKAAEEVTPQRIADLSDAGVKTADIATDQIVKQGTKQGLRRGGKLTRMMVKKFGAAGTRSILKKIPVVAGAAGVLFGIQRALEGDLFGAGLEITSGLLGATGVGGGLGLAIDGFLLGRDLGAIPMAKGALVSGPTNALVGEAGPELVTPLNDETFIKFGEGILNANKRNYSEFSKQNASWLANMGGSGEGDNSLFKINFAGNDKVDLDGISSNVREIAPAINSLSQQIVSTAGGGGTNVVNNVVNNYGSGGKPGEGGGEDNGGDFSSSGLDAFRLQYLGSLS
tara:strand:+ start:751 stop:2973 length:2223 start_codon:yes stop_codon:yes gene_type:complete